MTPMPTQQPERWLEAAQADLEAAQVLLSQGLFAAACFHCQQAAEKALKAYLYGQGEEEVRGHSVAVLCRSAARLDPRFAELAEQVGELDGFYLPTRYPNALVDATPDQVFRRPAAARARQMARQTLTLVQEAMKQP
jgi:HEPN domain-containing protein